MNKTLGIALFLLVAIIQLGVPVSMIVQREITLRNGERCLLRVEPVDPYDAFRGRYVWLRLEGSSVPTAKGQLFNRGDRVFALLTPQKEGFYTFTEIAEERPEDGVFLPATVDWQDAETVHLQLPIDRFYMEESKAPAAEQAVRTWNGETRAAHIAVRIRDGNVVIEELFVNDLPILEYLSVHAGAAS